MNNTIAVSSKEISALNFDSALSRFKFSPVLEESESIIAKVILALWKIGDRGAFQH
jgi:hypothetical protein